MSLKGWYGDYKISKFDNFTNFVKNNKKQVIIGSIVLVVLVFIIILTTVLNKDDVQNIEGVEGANELSAMTYSEEFYDIVENLYISFERTVNENIPGDLNRDGFITNKDYKILIEETTFPSNNGMLRRADMNNDGIVNGTDRNILKNILNNCIESGKLALQVYPVRLKESCNIIFEGNYAELKQFFGINRILVDNQRIDCQLTDSAFRVYFPPIEIKNYGITLANHNLVKICDLFNIYVTDKQAPIIYSTRKIQSISSKGDVNRDGFITSYDANLIIDHINTGLEIDTNAADLDGDGYITSNDASFITNARLYGNWESITTLQPVPIYKGETITFKVDNYDEIGYSTYCDITENNIFIITRNKNGEIRISAKETGTYPLCINGRKVLDIIVSGEKVAPTVSATQNSNYQKSHNIDITINGFLTSNNLSYCWSQDGNNAPGGSWTSTTINNNRCRITEGGRNGTWYLWVGTLTDVNGTQKGNNCVGTYKFDNGTPTISGVTNNTWYTNEPTVTYSNSVSKATGKYQHSGATYAFDSGKKFSDDGMYIITVTNEVGNKASCTFYVERTPPVISNISKSNSEENQKVIITATLNDNVSGVRWYKLSQNSNDENSQSGWTDIYTQPATYNARCEVDENGTYYLYAKNGCGLVSKQKIDVSTIEEKPETYIIDYNANGGEGWMGFSQFEYGYYERTGIEYNLKPNEFTRSGYRFEGWSVVPNGEIELWDNESQCAGGMDRVARQYAQNGVLYVYAKWKDIKEPYITGIEKDKWYTNNVTIKCKDDESGIKTASYVGTPYPSGTTKSGTFKDSIELSEDGWYTVNVEDNEKNKFQVSFGIEKTAPEITSLTANNTSDWTKGQITLTGTATDKTSAVASYQWSQIGNLDANSGNWIPINQEDTTNFNTHNPTTTTQNYNVSQNGTYYFYTKNGMGLVSKKAITVNNIDNKLPSSTMPQATSTKNSIVVTCMQTDGNPTSGIKTTEYAIRKNAEGETWRNYQNENTFTNLESGTEYQVKTRVTDNAGNQAESQVLTIKTIEEEKIPPKVTAVPEIQENYQKQISITLSIDQNVNEQNLKYAWSTNNSTAPDGEWQEVQIDNSQAIITETEKTGIFYLWVGKLTNEKNVESENKCFGPYYFDNTAPTITRVIGNRIEGQEGIIVAIEGANDAEVGLADEPYSFDNGESWQVENTKIYTQSESGIIIKVKDKLGNEYVNEPISIERETREKPVITLLGEKEITLEVFSTAPELGATAIDVYGRELEVKEEGYVNLNVLGTYEIKYNAEDSDGNKADEVIRIIHVVDTTKPNITLIGEETVEIETGTSYRDAGATAIDNYDKNISENIEIKIFKDNVEVEEIDTSEEGTYEITYTVKDSSGNISETVKRTINVIQANKITEIVLDNSEIEMIVGQMERLTASVKPETAKDKVLTWKSSNEDVATVNEYGYIKAIGEGETTITVESEEDQITATCLVKVKEPTEDDVIFKSEEEIIIESEGLILDVSPETTLEDLVNSFDSNVDYKIVDKEGNEVSKDELVATGMKIILDTEDNKEYTIIVKGDIDGDGLITITDLSMLKKSMIGLQELDEIESQAANVDLDNEIQITDLSKVVKYIIGLYEM